MTDMKKWSAIKKEVALIGGDKSLLNKRPFRALPDILHTHETILGYVYGLFEGGSFALIVATSKRIVFVNSAWGNLVVDDVPYNMVASVEYSLGVFWGRVTLFSRSKTYQFSLVNKKSIHPFVGVVEELILNQR